MNTLGIVLAWGAVQVTLFAVVGAAIYALARRRGPAAGSLAALASLLIVLAVSVLVFSPWPQWYSAETARNVIAVNDTAAIHHDEIDPAPTSSSVPADAVSQVTPPDQPGAPPSSPGQTGTDVDTRATAAAFWQAFVAELRPVPVAAEQPARRWPGMVAAVLGLGMILGVGRLALGLLAVRRLRAAALPITDDALLRHVDRLREQLDCSRTVEVRESGAIATPATIGWRRPLVILPLNWRAWTDREQDAVLAHEIAHVCRADYAAAILAQTCLAVHFYHPLVHWLARRLRLEQELAADALGARVAGGREQYLRSLAALALAQDNRRLAWAARPFLPESGTLLRRIEMLRDRKQQFQASLSRAWRVGLIAILVAAGLGIAGLRGPGEGAANIAQVAPPEAKEAQDNTPKTFSLDYIPANANFVLAIRPAELARYEALKPFFPLANEMFRMKARYGISFEQMEEVYFITCKKADAPGGYDELMIFRSIEALDVNKHAALLVRNPFIDRSLIIHTRDGNDSTRACYVPDVHTLVVGSLGTLRLLVAPEKREPLPRWAGQWKAVAGKPIALALDVKAIRGDVEGELSPTPGAAPWLKLAAPLWEQTDMVVAGVTVSDKLALHATAVCVSPEGAEKVHETSKALLTLALNMLDSMRADSSAAARGTPAAALRATKPVFDMGEKLLKSVKFSRADAILEAQVEAPLDSVAVAVTAVVAPAASASRVAAQRTQAMNQMKQIGLALHNYHDAKKRFPPAVVIGPDGKTPHSWRVAILPYLEQANAGPLYENYKLDEPWDSENNRKVLEKMPAVFRYPSDDAKSANTSYFAVTGDTAAFSGKDGNPIDGFKDGLSQTIMVVEAKRDVPWTKPEDIAYDPEKPLPNFGGYREEGFLALFADGAVRTIGRGVDEKVLRALLTKAGGEAFNFPQ